MKMQQLCGLCGERPGKVTRYDKAGHRAYLCDGCNTSCKQARMKVADIIARVQDREQERAEQ